MVGKQTDNFYMVICNSSRRRNEKFNGDFLLFYELIDL